MSVETVFILSLMVLFMVMLFKFLGWLGRGSHSPSSLSAHHARPVEDSGEFQQSMAQDHRHHTDAALISSHHSSHDHDSHDPPPSM